MIAEYQPDAVRWEGDRPVAVGDQDLGVPTRMVRTPAGFWAIYGRGDGVLVVFPGGALGGPPGEVRAHLQRVAGDPDRDGAEREAATSFLPYLGADDPGAAGDAPRSRVEEGPPPTYRLGDATNPPPGATPPYSGPEASEEGSPSRP
ncbi:MAG TPA: hypothetical protein VGM21_05135 [Actinomycetota bacterium]